MHRVFGKPAFDSFILGHSRNQHPRAGYRTWFSVYGKPSRVYWSPDTPEGCGLWCSANRRQGECRKELGRYENIRMAPAAEYKTLLSRAFSGSEGPCKARQGKAGVELETQIPRMGGPLSRSLVLSLPRVNKTNGRIFLFIPLIPFIQASHTITIVLCALAICF